MSTTPDDVAATLHAIDHDLRARRERTIADHVAAESRQDVAATLATFTDPNYDVVPFGGPTEGATAVAQMLQTLFDAFPDFNAEILEQYHGDDTVFIDARISGTHRGVWAGVPASGRRMTVRVGCLFHFDGDLLTKETAWFDHATMLAQITGGG